MNINDKDTINQRVRLVRRALKLNQADFAKQIGLIQTSLSMMEVGTNNVTDKTVKLICATFGVNERWLRDGTGEMFSASPYEKELSDILDMLTPETQEHLLTVARELLKLQRKLLGQSEDDYCKCEDE